MGKLSYIADFEANVNLIEAIKNSLDKLCEYNETDGFRMSPRDGMANTYEFQFDYKGYRVNGEIDVKEVFTKCETTDVYKISAIIDNLINQKFCEGLKKNL